MLRHLVGEWGTGRHQIKRWLDERAFFSAGFTNVSSCDFADFACDECSEGLREAV